MSLSRRVCGHARGLVDYGKNLQDTSRLKAQSICFFAPRKRAKRLEIPFQEKMKGGGVSRCMGQEAGMEANNR